YRDDYGVGITGNPRNVHALSVSGRGRRVRLLARAARIDFCVLALCGAQLADEVQVIGLTRDVARQRLLAKGVDRLAAVPGEEDAQNVRSPAFRGESRKEHGDGEQTTDDVERNELRQHAWLPPLTVRSTK